MLSLIYVSTARHGLSASDIGEIVDTSVAFNARHDITGLLAYNGTQFMQLLEGGDRDIDDLYGRICRDRRHHHVELLRRQPLIERECPDWSMQAFLTPFTQAGDEARFATMLPVHFRDETKMLFTGFVANIPEGGSGV